MITSRGYYSKNPAGDFFIWWYSDLLDRFIKIIRYFLIIVWDTFSIGLLLNSIFAPWRQDIIRAKNAPLNVKIQFLVWNLISRLIGFVVRFFVIMVGFAACFLVLILSGIGIIVYLVLPFGVMALFFIGIILAVKNG